MLGRDHALSSAVAVVAVSPLLHTGLPGLAAGTVFTAGAGLLPDIDEPHSTISRQGGYVTMTLAWVVRKAGGGHRMLTHSALGTALFTAGAWAAVHWDYTTAGKVILGLFIWLLLAAAMHALRFGGHHGDTIAAGAAAAAALGAVAHIAGDMLTHHGCPIAFPVSREDQHLLPERMRFTTGKAVEHWLVSPLLALGLAVALVWTSGYGPALLHLHPVQHVHLAGHFGR